MIWQILTTICRSVIHRRKGKLNEEKNENSTQTLFRTHIGRVPLHVYADIRGYGTGDSAGHSARKHRAAPAGLLRQQPCQLPAQQK